MKTLIRQERIPNPFWMYENEPFHVIGKTYSDGFREYVSGDPNISDSAGLQYLNSGKPLTFTRIDK